MYITTAAGSATAPLQFLSFKVDKWDFTLFASYSGKPLYSVLQWKTWHISKNRETDGM